MTTNNCIAWCVGSATALLLACGCSPALAINAMSDWQCSGSPVVSQYHQLDMDLDSGSAAGDTFNTSVDSGVLGAGTCRCRASGSFPSIFTATTPLPRNGNFLKLNDYLEAQLSIYISGPGYVTAPFSKARSNETVDCNFQDSTASGITSGQRSKVTFRLTKPIVNEVTYSGQLATLYWQISDNATTYESPYNYARYYAAVTLRAQASCTFKAGDTFTLDLGDIERPALVAGAPPKSYPPQSIDLSLDCSNTGSDSEINYMFEGTSGTEGNILLTDLQGLGIGLRDGDDKPVGLGLDNAIDVPVVSNATSFYLKPYPTKLPGQLVRSGHYTAHAIVTITLP